MNILSRMTSEAALGLGLGIGVAEQHVMPENNPAHIALIHGSNDAETPAPPALIDINVPRDVRRAQNLAKIVSVPAESIELHDIQDRIYAARIIVQARQRLNRMGRS